MSNNTTSVDSSDEGHLIEHLHSIETMGGFTIFFLLAIIFLIIFVYYKLKLMNEVKQPLMSLENNENLNFETIENNNIDPELAE